MCCTFMFRCYGGARGTNHRRRHAPLPAIPPAIQQATQSVCVLSLASSGPSLANMQRAMMRLPPLQQSPRAIKLFVTDINTIPKSLNINSTTSSPAQSHPHPRHSTPSRLSSPRVHQSTPAFPTTRSHPALVYTQSLSPLRSLLSTRTYSSMSDVDYEAFLNKANDGGSSGGVQEQSQKSYGTKSVNTAVPKVLEDVQEYYVSDADEPFEPVALNFDGGGDGLDAQQLGTLLSHSGSVTQLKVDEWDPKKQYKAIVDAVRKAAGGSDDIKVFKVELEGTRAEYYVVGVVEGKVLGLKALSVES
ncbi:unnamed protein product [Periconia digitata]|uniref:Uncharacterized protein n=1 Tax=Periconia digitata TaxID=1303443 RepID=A0A9W4UPR6_9PLEO|nr:unnamed protein product [Periconia digitata]